MDLKEIKQLIAVLEESQLKKLILKRGDLELHLEKEGEPAPVVYQNVKSQPLASPSSLESSAEKNSHKPMEVAGKYVTSPMVGTYYASPGPNLASFVKVGDKVQEHTIVCIIEAMKVMNEVKAGVAGTVAEILVDNSHPVEFGTKLLRIV
jgi:acetyl-CoA carboxylase biotin carboxyl carrier protein